MGGQYFSVEKMPFHSKCKEVSILRVENIFKCRNTILVNSQIEKHSHRDVYSSDKGHLQVQKKIFLVNSHRGKSFIAKT